MKHSTTVYGRPSRRQSRGNALRVLAVALAVASAAGALVPGSTARAHPHWTADDAADYGRLRQSLTQGWPIEPTHEQSALSDLDEWASALALAARFHVRPALAKAIYDAALVEGIQPELGFRVVRVESGFDPRAVSPVGAVGLTQVMPATAREMLPDVARDSLFDPATNARVGFRYLHGLIHEYRDVRLALIVYNRGPVAVARSRERGEDPSNGYDARVLAGSVRTEGPSQEPW